MAIQEQNRFPNEHHILLQGDNPRAIVNMFKQELESFEYTPNEQILWNMLRKQISSLNSPNIWYVALQQYGVKRDPQLINAICGKNYVDIEDLSGIVSGGLVSGGHFIEARVEQEKMTPVRELALTVVSDFDFPVSGEEELNDRVSYVFGSSKEPGKIQNSLIDLDTQLFVEQPTLTDLMSIYGDYFTEATQSSDNL